MAKMTKKELDEKVASVINHIANQTEVGTFVNTMRNHFTSITHLHNLSFNNQMLAIMQGATGEVHTFNQWLKLGRAVRKGEKSHIFLFRPQTFKKKEDENERGYTMFFTYPVFDIAQTDDIPGFEQTPEKEQTKESAALSKLMNAAKALNIRVTETLLRRKGLYGYSSGGNVVIAENLIPEQKVSTLAHELAHEILHQNVPPADRANLSKTVVESEAEMVAAVLMDYFGLDNDYSAAYVKMYGANREKLTDTLKSVQKAVSVLMKAMDEREEEGAEEVAA